MNIEEKERVLNIANEAYKRRKGRVCLNAVGCSSQSKEKT